MTISSKLLTALSLTVLSSTILSCSKDSKTIKQLDSSNLSVETIQKLKANQIHPKYSSVQSLSDKMFIPDRVFFVFDSSDISKEYQEDLELQAAYLKEKLAANSTLEVIIEGNCDERGGVEYNMALGQKRADSVKEFLVSEGISADKIKTVSFGKERVLVEGTTAIAYLQNRVSITKIESSSTK